MKNRVKRIAQKLALFSLTLSMVIGLPIKPTEVKALNLSSVISSVDYGLSNDIMVKGIRICFNHTYYATLYPDLKQAFGDDYDQLLKHWLESGIKEGRIASPIYDPKFYLDYNPDVEKAFGNDYVAVYKHFLQYGLNEGRISSPYYMGSFYKEYYQDLQDCDYSSLALHYLTYGYGEKRIASPLGFELTGWPSDTFIPRSITLDPEFILPLASYTRISSDFGRRIDPITLKPQTAHNGVDFASKKGTAIYAAYEGKVVAASENSTMGKYIKIDHGNGLYTYYMHASALYVKKGDIVKQGQTIAAVGSTGRSTGNHLHFAVMQNKTYVSPWKYIKIM